jgi:hypothetical protein
MPKPCSIAVPIRVLRFGKYFVASKIHYKSFFIVPMKNPFTSFIILLLFTLTIKAQTSSKIAINRGDIFITPSIGFPNFLTSRIKEAHKLNEPNKVQLSSRSSVPLGINASYEISQNIAMGTEISYESTQIKWRENETLIGNDSTTIPVIYHYTLNASRIRVLVILNYHFAVREHTDWYFGFGLGYSHNTTKLTTEATNTFYENLSPCFLPISTRTKVGVNYCFLKNIAVNAEVGIGGPLVCLGITAKF